MSGWIRVKELPTRYEVQAVGTCGYEVAWSREQALGVLFDWRGQEPSRKIKLVTIRRHQVKRTEVTEYKSKFATFYNACEIRILTAYRMGGQWAVTQNTFGTREEAEAAARKWLRDNGYRLRKPATVGGAL